MRPTMFLTWESWRAAGLLTGEIRYRRIPQLEQPWERFLHAHSLSDWFLVNLSGDEEWTS